MVARNKIPCEKQFTAASLAGEQSWIEAHWRGERGAAREMNVTITLKAQRHGPGLCEMAAGAALITSVAWFTLGSESILRPGTYAFRDGVMLVPWMLALTSLAMLRAVLGKDTGAVAHRAFVVVFAAMALATVGQMGLIVDSMPLKAFGLLGIVGFIGGMMAIGIGLWRSGAVPRGLAVALALTQPLTMAAGVAMSPWVPLTESGSYSGAVVHGVTWLLLGAYLLRRSDA
jgi:hypothetical protein